MITISFGTLYPSDAEGEEGCFLPKVIMQAYPPKLSKSISSVMQITSIDLEDLKIVTNTHDLFDAYYQIILPRIDISEQTDKWLRLLRNKCSDTQAVVFDLLASLKYCDLENNANGVLNVAFSSEKDSVRKDFMKNIYRGLVYAKKQIELAQANPCALFGQEVGFITEWHVNRLKEANKKFPSKTRRGLRNILAELIYWSETCLECYKLPMVGISV